MYQKILWAKLIILTQFWPKIRQAYISQDPELTHLHSIKKKKTLDG